MSTRETKQQTCSANKRYSISNFLLNLLSIVFTPALFSVYFHGFTPNLGSDSAEHLSNTVGKDLEVIVALRVNKYSSRNAISQL